MGYSPEGLKESDTTERLNTHTHTEGGDNMFKSFKVKATLLYSNSLKIENILFFFIKSIDFVTVLLLFYVLVFWPAVRHVGS